MKNIYDRIKELKKEKNAIILAHTYTYGDVQDLADYVGDSYGLSKKAAMEKDADIIVFAGVRFMAETAAILAPEKKVILPVENAGCPMADMIGEAELVELKKKYPDAAVACYMNSTAEIKALSDVCVTSSNAVNVIRKLDAKKVIFVPDSHLGSFVAEKVPEKEFILFPGFCIVHQSINREEIEELKKKHPDAVVMMHPECRKETRELADFILSTGGMVDLVSKKAHKKYIVVTEQGIIHALKKHNPDAEYIIPSKPQAICSNMKKIIPEAILDALENEKNVVKVPGEIADKARKSLELMLELAE